MAKSRTPSKSFEEARKVAKATQRPGQSKEQTRLITQGIQKGIEEYKKQQKVKARELDKSLKKVRNQLSQSPELGDDRPPVTQEVIKYQQHWLPWALLVVSWTGFAVWAFI